MIVIQQPPPPENGKGDEVGIETVVNDLASGSHGGIIAGTIGRRNPLGAAPHRFKNPAPPGVRCVRARTQHLRDVGAQIAKPRKSRAVAFGLSTAPLSIWQEGSLGDS